MSQAAGQVLLGRASKSIECVEIRVDFFKTYEELEIERSGEVSEQRL